MILEEQGERLHEETIPIKAAGKSILFYIPRLPSEIMFCNMALKIHLSALHTSLRLYLTSLSPSSFFPFVSPPLLSVLSLHAVFPLVPLRSQSYRNAFFCQILFHLSDFQFFIVKQRRRQSRICHSFCKSILKMF